MVDNQGKRKIQLVPLSEIHRMMDESCKLYGLSRTESQITDALLQAFPVASIQNNNFVTYNDVVQFIDNWIRAIKAKNFDFIAMRRGKKWELPNDYEEILCSPKYLNQGAQVRPAIKREFLRLYENGAYYPEVILTGATGIGKDYLSYAIYAVTLMELYCYWNPQIEFGLAAGTSMILAIQSITKELAKQVTFNELVGTFLINSPFFREVFPWDRTVTSELRFPNNIYVRPFSGEDTAALGMAIFSCFPGDFEYVTATGQYARFSEELNVPIMTYSDTEGYYPTESSVPSVITGYNREVIRLWFGDDYIDCTPDQQFKNTDGEWIYAENCGNHRIISCDLSDMSNSCDLHRTTFGLQTFGGDEKYRFYPSSICKDKQQKNDLSIFQGIGSDIHWALCTKVERLNSFCTVYDVINVPKTNTLIVPTRNRKFHLVAHNSVVNEANFMGVVSKSKKAGGGDFNQAERIYRTLSRRIAGRFTKHGKVPGKMIVISSANKEGDFIHRRLEEIKNMPQEEQDRIFIMNMSQWEAFEGTDKLLEGTFLVEKGNEVKQSRIIESREDAIDPEDVVEIPMDYLKFFKEDIDGALADIGGVFVSRGRRKFIPYREAIAAAVAAHKILNDDQQLFRYDEVIFDDVVDPDNPDFTKIVNMDYVGRMLSRDLPQAGHIDYGFVEDATGVAVVNIQSYKLVDRVNVWNPQTRTADRMSKVSLPVFHVEGAMGIKASRGSEVDIDFVEGLFCFLKEHINIVWITSDSYESRSSRQTFKKLGINTGVVSTVTTNEPYTELKEAIKTGRILLPDNKILLKEIREIERMDNGKIDHPQQGSKDISDAVAACIYVLTRKALQNVTNRRRQVEHRASGEARQSRVVRKSRFSTV